MSFDFRLLERAFLLLVWFLMSVVSPALLYGQAQDESKRKDQIANLIALNDLLNRLTDDMYASEIELTATQRAELKKMHEKFVPLMSRATLERHDDPDEKVAALQNAADFGKKSTAQINGLLLPHQKTWYRNIRAQQKLGIYRNPNGFESESLAKQMKLSSKQRDSIKAILAEYKRKMAKISKESKEKFDRLKSKSQSESRSVLNSEQHTKYEKFFGKQKQN